MRKLLIKIKAIPNYLSFQIFSLFWLTFAILLGITLVLPHFDARAFSEIDDTEKSFFQKESDQISSKYDLNEIFYRNLPIRTSNNYDLILLEPDSGVIAGAYHQLKALQIFIYRADNPQTPLKRRFVDKDIFGPFIAKSENNSYWQYFIKSVAPQQKFFNIIFDSTGMMLLLILLISTPILLWLSWKIAKPIKALRYSANAVATGDLTINPKLETEGIHELRGVGRSFNKMILSLQELTYYQQRLLSDISHELKTPLTRLQLTTAIIRRRVGESNELQRIENETKLLDKMVHDLLSLSRQQLNNHLNRGISTINKIWEDVFSDAEFEAEQHGINFYVSQRVPFPEKYFINGNVNMLASAVENVIRNAQKYANKNIKVLIYISKTDLFIIVDDDGNGIPDDQYEQIFRPFYRIDEARSRSTGGTGLGLAIVANAIKQHQGSVIAKKSPLGGLRVKIKLPLWLE